MWICNETFVLVKRCRTQGSDPDWVVEEAVAPARSPGFEKESASLGQDSIQGQGQGAVADQESTRRGESQVQSLQKGVCGSQSAERGCLKIMSSGAAWLQVSCL